MEKCGEASCSTCQPITLPEEEAKRLFHFPDPLLRKNSDHFQDFASVYGKPTTEKDRPSLKSGVPSTAGGTAEPPPFVLKAERVRRTECDTLVHKRKKSKKTSKHKERKILGSTEVEGLMSARTV